METKKLFPLLVSLVAIFSLSLFGVFTFLAPSSVQADDQTKSSKEITIVGEVRAADQSQSVQEKSQGQLPENQSSTSSGQDQVGQDQVSPERSGENQSSTSSGQDQISPERSGENQSSTDQSQVSSNKEDAALNQFSKDSSTPSVELAEKSNWILFETVKKVYTVVNDGKGQELAQHIGCKVKATGILNTDASGKELFTVSSFEILEHAKDQEHKENSSSSSDSSMDSSKDSSSSSDDTRVPPRDENEVPVESPESPR